MENDQLQIVENILTPPNWSNEGKNQELNKSYKQLLDDYFGTYIDDLKTDKYTDYALFKFKSTEEGYQSAFNMFGKGRFADKDKEHIGLNLLKNHDNVILEIHGGESGKVGYGSYDFKINEIIQRLEDTGLIPPNTRQIYTMSCYGGLQEKGLTASGIPFESLHTSLEPTIGYGHIDIFEEFDNTSLDATQYLIDYYQNDIVSIKEDIETYRKLLELNPEDKLYKEEFQYYKKQLKFSKKKLKEQKKQFEKLSKEIANQKEKVSTLANLTKSGNTTDKFKKDTLRLFEKHKEHFADIEFISSPEEINNALWDLLSPYKKEETNEFIKSYEKLIVLQDQIMELDQLATNGKSIERHTKEKQELLSSLEKHKKDLIAIEEKDKLYGKDYKSKDRFLTPQEAFDKYGPDDDMFYVSQGLNPEEQKLKINELNSKRKPVPSDEEILNQLHKETEEAAEQFIKTSEESEQILKDLKSEIKKQEEQKLKLQEIKSQPKVESVAQTRTIIKEPSKINFEQILEETAQETVDNGAKKLENKTIQGTAKKALNTKSLGVIAIGATAALATIAGIDAHSKNERKKKEKRAEETINRNVQNNQYMNHNDDLKNAEKVSQFSKGHYSKGVDFYCASSAIIM